MSCIEVVHSIRESISPHPWAVWQVVPVTSNEDVFGFAAIRKKETAERYIEALESSDCIDVSTSFIKVIELSAQVGANILRDLPVEFFSHELKALNYSDPEEAARFFTEYGLFGYVENIGMISLARSVAKQRIGKSDYMSRFDHAIREFDAKGYQIVQFAPLAESMRETEILLRYAQIVKGCATSETNEALATFLGCERAGLESLIHDTFLEVNKRFFSSASVSVGYTNDGKNASFPGAAIADGSLGQAIALQIKQFAADIESGYLQCSECGEIFVHKQSSKTRTRKPSRNAKAVFCCDRCKNRFAQREHRKTPGYRNKQDMKRADKR